MGSKQRAFLLPRQHTTSGKEGPRLSVACEARACVSHVVCAQQLVKEQSNNPRPQDAPDDLLAPRPAQPEKLQDVPHLKGNTEGRLRHRCSNSNSARAPLNLWAGHRAQRRLFSLRGVTVTRPSRITPTPPPLLRAKTHTNPKDRHTHTHT